MKYYKDTAGNVYAYNAIQKHRAGLVALTEKEIEAHLKPKEPTNEEKAERLKAEIRELELKQLRSLKAIMSDTVAEEDEVIYSEIEAEIVAKREEIRRLDNGN